MSTRDFWRDKLTFIRREKAGLDTTTRLPKFSETVVLKDEPCDLAYVKRRVAVQTPSGTVFMTVETPQLKIFPPLKTQVPNQNDLVVVNGIGYRVEEAEDTLDGGSGRYMGSKLWLKAPEEPEAPNPQAPPET